MSLASLFRTTNPRRTNGSCNSTTNRWDPQAEDFTRTISGFWAKHLCVIFIIFIANIVGCVKWVSVILVSGTSLVTKGHIAYQAPLLSIFYMSVEIYFQRRANVFLIFLPKELISMVATSYIQGSLVGNWSRFSWGIIIKQFPSFGYRCIIF